MQDLLALDFFGDILIKIEFSRLFMKTRFISEAPQIPPTTLHSLWCKWQFNAQSRILVKLYWVCMLVERLPSLLDKNLALSLDRHLHSNST